MTTRECARCGAQKAEGGRCTRSTCKWGPQCWQHSRKNFGLTLRKSNIPGAGLGLFALKDFDVKDTVAEYNGRIIDHKTHEALDSGYSIKYTGALSEPESKWKYIDGSSTQTGLGRYANNCRRRNRDAGQCGTIPRPPKKDGTPRPPKQTENNTKISVNHNRTGNRATLKATKKIKAGEEIFTSYGPGYWKDDDKKERKQREEKGPTPPSSPRSPSRSPSPLSLGEDPESEEEGDTTDSEEFVTDDEVPPRSPSPPSVEDTSTDDEEEDEEEEYEEEEQPRKRGRKQSHPKRRVKEVPVIQAPGGHPDDERSRLAMEREMAKTAAFQARPLGAPWSDDYQSDVIVPLAIGGSDNAIESKMSVLLVRHNVPKEKVEAIRREIWRIRGKKTRPSITDSISEMVNRPLSPIQESWSEFVPPHGAQPSFDEPMSPLSEGEDDLVSLDPHSPFNPDKERSPISESWSDFHGAQPSFDEPMSPSSDVEDELVSLDPVSPFNPDKERDEEEFARLLKEEQDDYHEEEPLSPELVPPEKPEEPEKLEIEQIDLTEASPEIKPRKLFKPVPEGQAKIRGKVKDRFEKGMDFPREKRNRRCPGSKVVEVDGKRHYVEPQRNQKCLKHAINMVMGECWVDSKDMVDMTKEIARLQYPGDEKMQAEEFREMGGKSGPWDAWALGYYLKSQGIRSRVVLGGEVPEILKIAKENPDSVKMLLQVEPHGGRGKYGAHFVGVKDGLIFEPLHVNVRPPFPIPADYKLPSEGINRMGYRTIRSYVLIDPPSVLKGFGQVTTASNLRRTGPPKPKKKGRITDPDFSPKDSFKVPESSFMKDEDLLVERKQEDQGHSSKRLPKAKRSRPSYPGAWTSLKNLGKHKKRKS